MVSMIKSRTFIRDIMCSVKVKRYNFLKLVKSQVLPLSLTVINIKINIINIIIPKYKIKKE